MAKINISINDDLLHTVDQIADDNFLSRSGLISLALVQYVNQSKLVSSLENVSNCFSVIARNNEIDSDSLKTLKEFQMLCQMMQKK